MVAGTFLLVAGFLAVASSDVGVVVFTDRGTAIATQTVTLVQRAHFEAHIRGRGVPRAGEIFSLA